MKPAGSNLLGIYLNDHLAGATAGTELARRIGVTVRADKVGAASRQVEELEELRVRAASRVLT